MTTIRVGKDTRASLERLRARLVLAKGRRANLDELVKHLAHRAEAHPEIFVGNPRDEGPNLTDDEWDRIFAMPFDWGVTTSADEIDDVVYADDRH